MRHRSRPSLAPLALVALVGVLAAGIWLGGHPQHLPGTIRDALVGDSSAQLYQEALDTINRDYYRKVSVPQLSAASLQGLVRSLRDQYSSYFDPQAYKRFEDETNSQFSGVGLSVEQVKRGLRVREVFAGTPARRAGMRAGDVVVAVDGRSIAGLPQGEATPKIQGKPGTKVTLTVERDGRRRTLRLTRARVVVPVVRTRLRTVRGELLAQVGLSSFSDGAHGEVRQAIDAALKRGAKGILLDLRGDPGGLLNEAVLVASIFVADGPIVSTAGRARERRVFDAVGSSIDPKIPVAVLVDRGTASAAEIVTGALQDRGRAKVIGSYTFGKGVFQEIERLSNGGALKLTVGEYFLPSGRNLGGGGVKEGKGIKPDVPAPGPRALGVALRTLALEAR